MNNFYEMLRDYVKGNLVNTVILVIMAISFNKKLNLILIDEATDKIRIESLERDMAEVKKKQALDALKIAAHIGAAYIREEDSNE